MGASTVAGIVHQVCTAIWDCLLPDYMPIPDKAAWRKIATGFQQLDFPNCLGAMDGKHVVIEAPPSSGTLLQLQRHLFHRPSGCSRRQVLFQACWHRGLWKKHWWGNPLLLRFWYCPTAEHIGYPGWLHPPRARTSWPDASCVSGRRSLPLAP